MPSSIEDPPDNCIVLRVFQFLFFLIRSEYDGEFQKRISGDLPEQIGDVSLPSVQRRPPDSPHSIRRLPIGYRAPPCPNVPHWQQHLFLYPVLCVMPQPRSIPPLLLFCPETDLIPGTRAIRSVLWHINDGMEEVLADYVHHEMTRTWISICLRLFVVIMTKDVVVAVADL
ncbi:hypothetical protein SASPL_114349 [Salvia splendens]|uniref:Uncharacterized protein n=1 Tax=Salvia splendens TaxID=180675 RepID=A0A8X9A140_SALSN|nr:hypothetical protein SASPL_114349 [Salvia splendens]